MKLIFGIVVIFLLFSFIAAKKARLYKVLADDFRLNLNFNPCSGQTACLCYKTLEKERRFYNFSSLYLSVLCDNPQDAFICARHKILSLNPSTSNETENGESALVVLTSALKEQITSKMGFQNVNSLSFYVNINEKNVKIDSSSNIIISEFWRFHYKSLDQRIVKLFVSSCEDNVQITSSNLEEVDVKESLENSSIWETITTYLYNTGDKALNVASTALKILAGVLKIDIWGPDESYSTPIPFIKVTPRTDPTTTTTSLPSSSTSPTTTKQASTTTSTAK